MDSIEIKKDILAVLTYFDLFRYPLKREEIYNFLSRTIDKLVFEIELNKLVDECLIFKLDQFYSLHDKQTLVERRIAGNKRAISLTKKSGWTSSLISACPFVKGVAVSGSLSKNFAEVDADIDYFIITAKNRLWIARTCLHLLKKVFFLISKRDLFCMNYFIDESNMRIREKNVYTAMEVMTLLPIRGKSQFESFFNQNSWANGYFPNAHCKLSMAQELKPWFIQRIVERLLNGKVGDSIDNYLMKVTSNRWMSKTKKGKKNRKGFILNMDIGKQYSKPNPANFQNALLKKYEQRLAENYSWFEMSHYF